MKRTLLSAALVAAVLVASCTESQPTALGSGSLDLQVIVVEAFSGGQPALAINPDSSRVVLTGPESRTLRATPGGSVSFGELTPGTYSVVLETFEGDEVVVSGSLTGISVTAGEQTDVAEEQLLIAPTGVRFVALGERLELRAPAGTNWTTSDASIATVDASGVITAVGNGQVSIRGALGNASVLTSALIQQEVANVTVTPGTATIDAGQNIQFTAEAFDTAGAALTDVNFLWIASDHNVAIVDQNGLATGTGGGTVTIAATGRGEPGTAALAVNSATPTQLAFRTQPPALADLAYDLSPALQVEVRDAAGNLVRDAGIPITLSLPDNAAGLQLVGTPTVNAVDGIATFSGLGLSLRSSPFAVQPDITAEQYNLVASSGALTDATSDPFDMVDAPRLGDVVIYRDAVAWSGFVELAMQNPPLLLTEGEGYFVRPLAGLQSGIPSETSVIIVSSAMSPAPVAVMNDPAAVANLREWVRNGGWLTVHAGDNAAGVGYTVPGLLGPADDVTECTGQNLMETTHPLAAGPDKDDPVDDLNDDNVDFSFYGGSCADNHGSLDGILPVGATVILSAGTSGLPTYATYRYGNGRVTVTTLTIECCTLPDRAPLIVSHAWWAIYGTRPTPLADFPAVPLAAPLAVYPEGQSSTVPWSAGPGN